MRGDPLESVALIAAASPQGSPCRLVPVSSTPQGAPLNETELQQVRESGTFFPNPRPRLRKTSCCL